MTETRKAGGDGPPDFDFYRIYRRLLGVVSKRRWTFLLTFAVVIGATIAYLMTAPRIYEARTSIIIESSTPQALGSNFRDIVDMELGAWWSAHEYMQTQYAVLRSDSLAAEVAKRLPPDKLAKLNVGEGDVAVSRAARIVHNWLDVEPVKDSRVVIIRFRYTDPDVAALLANEVADTYMDVNLKNRLKFTSWSSGWLGTQLETLKSKLEDSERELYDFRLKNNVLSVGLEDNRNILANKIQHLSQAATEAETKRIQLAARRKVLTQLQSGDPLQAPMLEGKDYDLLAKLKEIYIDQNAKLLELQGKYLEKHPVVIAQAARVEAVHNQLRKEAEVATKSVQAQYELAAQTEHDLNAALETAKQDALILNRKQIEFDRIKRTVDNNSKMYDLVSGRLKETDLAGQVQKNNVRPLDRAYASRKPVSPRVTLILTAMIFLGLLASMGITFLLDFIDNTVKSQEDIEGLLGIPFLGLIPKMTEADAAPNVAASALFVHEQPKSTVAEFCRAIRTNVMFMSPDRPLRSLLITSSGPQEGKSTTSINMAITMAQAGSRVLLIDTDFRRPRLHRAFGVPSEQGMSTLVLGESRIEDVVKTTAVPNLWVIPCGPLPPNPAELLQTARFREVMAQLVERFDRLIFDSPPLAAVTDAAILSVLVDGTMLVAKSSHTTREMLSRARRQLVDVKSTLLGCILNNVDLTSREYGYHYYYYQRYGYYYGDDKENAPARG